MHTDKRPLLANDNFNDYYILLLSGNLLISGTRNISHTSLVDVKNSTLTDELFIMRT